MSDDFVHWDDLDLDYFLGKYTDDESGALVEAESSESDSENKPPTIRSPKAAGSKAPKAKHWKCNKSQLTVAVYYICLVCQKELKTIGGFRGHVSKKHNNTHLKGDELKWVSKPFNMLNFANET